MGSAYCTANQPTQQTESTKKVTFNQKDLKSEVLEPTNHKMSKKGRVNRTVSIIKAEDHGELLKRNPNMEEVLPKFVDVQQFVVEVIGQEDIEDFKELHKLFNGEILQPFEKLNTDEQRLLMGDHMAKIGFVKPLVDLYGKILEEHDLCDGISPLLEEEDEEEEYYHVIKDIKTILWNFSDASKDFGLAISEQTDLFQFLVKDLQATYKEGVPKLTDKEFCFNSSVGIITNCGRAGVNKSSFNVEVSSNQGDNDTTTVNIHMVDVLIPFLQSELQFVKLTTLMALSYMVNEDQNKFLTADPSLFDFLLDMITEAVKEKDKRHEGFSVHELIDGLAGLAKNDDNKVKIMERKKTYTMLKNSVIKSKSEDQQLAAVRAIWELAFAEKNKKKFTGDKELMSHLERLQKHNNFELAESVGKALFVINPANEYNLMKSVDGKKSIPEDPEHRQHIMISYQWANQKTILQIKDKLTEHNFPVWIDVEFMEGSMLQMMASAIEKAAVVLVCYSEKYKDSKNCRTEAEYAFARDKMVIPVLLENRYRPDGWLGILIGSKKFYDFSGKYDFDKKFREMKTELDGVMNPAARKQSMLPQPTYVPQPEINKEEIVLLQWKRQDMKNWLQQNDLQAFTGLQELSGEQLCFLYKLFIRAPDFFYKCLETKLGLKSLEELMKFDQALEKLAKDHPEINKLVR